MRCESNLGSLRVQSAIRRTLFTSNRPKTAIDRGKPLPLMSDNSYWARNPIRRRSTRLSRPSSLTIGIGKNIREKPASARSFTLFLRLRASVGWRLQQGKTDPSPWLGESIRRASEGWRPLCRIRRSRIGYSQFSSGVESVERLGGLSSGQGILAKAQALLNL